MKYTQNNTELFFNVLNHTLSHQSPQVPNWSYFVQASSAGLISMGKEWGLSEKDEKELVALCYELERFSITQYPETQEFFQNLFCKTVSALFVKYGYIDAPLIGIKAPLKGVKGSILSKSKKKAA